MELVSSRGQLEYIELGGCMEYCGLGVWSEGRCGYYYVSEVTIKYHSGVYHLYVDLEYK